MEPPFGIPRDEIFASNEQEKEINLKKTSRTISRVTIPNWTDHMTLLCIGACNVGVSVFLTALAPPPSHKNKNIQAKLVDYLGTTEM